jgi:2-keto-4-pentenoate hydratase/2-oxohepta-3-ene-1,7-dioic acid hydratase in catechol pathway
MIFPVHQIIEFLSGSTTLEPGTLILTGTPEGVGMGRKPPLFLKAGDVVECEIEGFGILRNPVIEEELS